MTHPDTVCRLCGRRISWRARRFAWVHTGPHGIEHPPIPVR